MGVADLENNINSGKGTRPMQARDGVFFTLAIGTGGMPVPAGSFLLPEYRLFPVMGHYHKGNSEVQANFFDNRFHEQTLKKGVLVAHHGQ